MPRQGHAEMHHANARVEHIQTALNHQGAHLEVDGTMGPKTVAALKTFQKSHHLKVTGKADAATLKALGV
jgi:peptidoglycan hydrolase-like protein with peptidoglycan-binding domain